MTKSIETVEPICQAAHLCIDMQRLFSTGGVWETPWMSRVGPAITEVASRYRDRTIFTRFIPPQRAEDCVGRWQRYYRRWEAATLQHLPPQQLDLLPDLARLTPPALVIDKPVYSAFKQSNLATMLGQLGVGTVVITGAETDVCVLATVLDAVDLGYRVVLVEDALCSSSDPGHDALMTMYRTRFHEQIDLVSIGDLHSLWEPGRDIAFRPV
ncbi:cysteine hydrolase family protein [Rhodopseudomonas sp.]|uniref:cysteine hydrolase family protein n=1 Tax=Rhodopseudomonas sp. TaxID=1078 RepID=UPI003B3BBF50